MRILLVGARGEVGRSLLKSLTDQGHTVTPATSSDPEPEEGLLSVEHGLTLVRDRSLDLIVNAGGPGDRRMVDRNPRDLSRALGSAARESRTPAVLISTVRVMEGAKAPFKEIADPMCHTPYGLANAKNEKEWLTYGDTYARILRLTNFFGAPARLNSPQAQLLPWSLVTEALTTGAIRVRSSPNVGREFIQADDAARALTLIAERLPAQRMLVTTPGLTINLGSLVELVQEAFSASGRQPPEVTFGSEGTEPIACLPGWLSENGWDVSLDHEDILRVVTRWLASVT